MRCGLVATVELVQPDPTTAARARVMVVRVLRALVDRRRVQRPGATAAGVAMAVVVSVPLVAGCVPKDLRNPTEVGGAREVVEEPPAFPETGEVPADLLVEGLVYDFSTNEGDLNLWTPSASEARCAAEAIVELYGEQLSDLGYEPGVDGAGINDVALTSTERYGVVQLFTGCVNAEQMLGMLFLGDGHMHPSEAACMARGLADSPLPGHLVSSWINGEGFDPIGEDASDAELILAHGNVCLPADSFLWNGLQLPGADPEEADSVTSATESRPAQAGSADRPRDPGP